MRFHIPMWVLTCSISVCLFCASQARAEFVDCNSNGISDVCDISCGTAGGVCDTNVCGQSADCNTNGVPDECDFWSGVVQPTYPVPLNANADADSDYDFSPHLATDGLGNWMTVWMSWDDLGGTIGSDSDILFARSTDNGATWTYPEPLNGNADTDSGGDWSPRVTTDGSGNWVAVWNSTDDLGGAIGTDPDILFARSTDNGATWTYPEPLNANADVDSGDVWSLQLTTDGLGHWVAVWRSDDDLGGWIGTDSDILLAQSLDNGATWTDPAPLNANADSDSGVDYSPHLATDGSGNWIAMWTSDDDLGGTIGMDHDVLFARSTNNGATWTDPEPLVAYELGFWYPDGGPHLTTDGAGTWVVLWTSYGDIFGTIDPDGEPIVLFSRSTDIGATWTAPEPLNTNVNTWGGGEYRPQLTTDGLGNWVAVWMSYDPLGWTIGTDLDILFARSTDNGATWTYPVPLSANAYVPIVEENYPHLITDGSGNWVAVWEFNDYFGGPTGTDTDIFFTRFQLDGSPDCNLNGVLDECDIAGGTSPDCNTNGMPDECEPDCNGNGVADVCDVTGGASDDCNANGVPDECESDCNGNDVADMCDLTDGASIDCNANGVPDECEPDCNGNGIADACDVAAGSSADCDGNRTPDECETDCNANGIPDTCDIAAGSSADCNATGTPDECDVAAGTSSDCDSSNFPDECDIAAATAPDCNANDVPDDCDLATGTSDDCNTTGIPDECEVFSSLMHPTYPVPLNSNADVDRWNDFSPQLATDGSGTWIAVWASDDNLDGTIGRDLDILFARSADNGETWSTPGPLNGNADVDGRGNDERPQLTTDSLGNWVAVWQSQNDLGGAIGTDLDILFARSTDNGATWTYPEPLNANAGSDLRGDWYPQLTTDGSGIWMVVWHSFDTLDNTTGTDSDILFARSTDNGATWTYPDPLNADAYSNVGFDYSPQLSTDGLGLWVAVWESDIGADRDIMFARSTDDGVTWTFPRLLDANAGADSGQDRNPQVTTDGSGNWIAVWYSYEGGAVLTDDNILFARSADNGTTWTYPKPLYDNGEGATDFSSEPQLTTDGFGNWVAVWRSGYDLGGTIGWDWDILFVRSADNGMTWTAPEPLNVNAEVDSRQDYRPQLTTDGSGTWVAAWSSSESLGGTIGTDRDILFTRFRLGTEPDCNLNSVLDACEADCDSNGVPDECEVDCDLSGVADVCELVGDVDHDGFVDAADLDGFLACLTGPCASLPCVPALYADECCVVADGDGDGDVDLLDFRNWQYVFDRVCDVDSDCDDGLFCSGFEMCVDGLCQRGSDPCTGVVNTLCLEDLNDCGRVKEDFETYACGGEADFWVDTEPDGSLVVNDDLFDVACVGNTRALHTASTDTNVHSHYTEPGSADWSSITYAGRMMSTDFTGGTGVTFMSQYLNDARYYRLRRTQWTPTYHISPSAGVEIPVGTIDTGVRPARNVWHRFVIEVTDTGTRTEIRAKVWRDGDSEPAMWQVDCYDASPTRLTKGTVGVWSMGDGEKYWDDLAVVVGEP